MNKNVFYQSEPGAPRFGPEPEPPEPEPQVQVQVRAGAEPNLPVQVRVRVKYARTRTEPDRGQSINASTLLMDDQAPVGPPPDYPLLSHHLEQASQQISRIPNAMPLTLANLQDALAAQQLQFQQLVAQQVAAVQQQIQLVIARFFFFNFWVVLGTNNF
jgi:hypothetical protein